MKSKEEREYERRKRWADEMYERYKLLSPWNQFMFWLFLDQLILKHWFESIPLNWFKFVLDMDRQFERHGMPYAVKRQLEKWFNYPPDKDDKYFMVQGRKVWYHCFVEEDNLELHLYHRGHFPGNIWLQPEKDGTATIIGIHIREGYRDLGLGTLAFWEAVNQIKDRVCCLKGLLEKEDYPEPEDSLRWLRRQGFVTRQNENGDYELELHLNE